MNRASDQPARRSASRRAAAGANTAADRDPEDILRVYVLGQVVGQDDLSGFTFHNSTDLLNVGRLNSSSGFRRFMHGWIDELRFTKGVARYAGSFVPPQGPFSRYKAQGVATPGAAGRDRHGA